MKGTGVLNAWQSAHARRRRDMIVTYMCWAGKKMVLVQCPLQSLYMCTGHGSKGSVHIYNNVYGTNGRLSMQKLKKRAMITSWKKNGLRQICQLKILKTL